MSPTKKAKLSASLEDYLETIFNLAAQSEGARSKDIAEALGVARSSVTGALRLLRERGLANYEPYGCISLTESGRAIAAEVARKHDILTSFFTDVLGVDSDNAQRGACKAEHALGPEIIGRLLSFVQYVTESQRNGRGVAEEFRRFYESESRPANRTVSE